MKITSSAFENNTSIPAKYTCDGERINPPLIFSEIPSESKSLALFVEDPDVPKELRPDGLFVHWMVWNIDPKTTEIPENSTPNGIIGPNTRGVNAYAPPCPPDREHRYFFKLFALDTSLDLPTTASREEFLEAIQGHIIEEAQIIGLYERETSNH